MIMRCASFVLAGNELSNVPRARIGIASNSDDMVLDLTCPLVSTWEMSPPK